MSSVAEYLAQQRASAGEGGEAVIRFPEGLPGFDQAHGWQLAEREDAKPFLWLRAVELPRLSLLLVDPRVVAPDYDAGFSRSELARVGLAPGQPYVVLVVVTLGAEATVNLRAPIVINPATLVGAQVILENPKWPLRHSLLPSQDR